MKSNSKLGFARLLSETRIFGEVASFALYGLFHRALPITRRHRRGVFLRPLFEWAHSRCPEGLEAESDPVQMSLRPPRVPETLIYSRSDGVVRWQNCVELGAHVEAIEIPSSHCGIPFHPATFEIIVDRLARSSERSHHVAANSALPIHRRFHRLRRSLAAIKRSRQVA